MNKESVLADFELLTIEQALIISKDIEGENGETVAVVKTVDGNGFEGDLSLLITRLYQLGHQARQWVIVQFYKKGIQSMGGRPDCPC